MKRVLITGANSYIGTNVERWLLKEPEKYHVETLDMKDPNWVNFDFSKFDVVFHVAGIAHIKETKKNKALYYKVNRDLAFKTAKKAKESGVKQFIFLSTMGVYGIDKGVITKDTIPNPKNAYGKSKLEAEQIINSLKSKEFNITILRPPMVYGYNSPGNYQRLSKISLKLLFHPKISNQRSMLYIDNLAINIKSYIDEKKSGLFFPQNPEYVNTSSLITAIRSHNNKKAKETRLLNLFIYVIMLFSKSTRKLFNSLVYKMDAISSDNYIDFNESIHISENGYKKRVLILSNDAKYTYDFRKEIIDKLIEYNYDVFVATPESKYSVKLTELGANFIAINYKRHGKNPLADYKLYKKYKKTIMGIKPTVVLTYTIKPNIYGGMAANALKIPYIVNITGLGSAVENKGLLQKFTTFLYRKSLKNVHTVFFQNIENMQYFVDKKIALDKHELIPGSGVNLEQFKLMPYPSDDIIRFVFIGRIMKEKGIDYFLEAARQLKKKYDNLEFHVCGFLEENYKNIIDDFVSNNTIIYHGLVNDTSKILNDMHAIIHPTYYPEGISNVLLESAASGRPGIASNRSGCKEIIIDEVTGYLFETKNQDDMIQTIEKFIKLSNKEKETMGLNGRTKVEKEFDRKYVINSYIDEIKTIIK